MCGFILERFLSRIPFVPLYRGSWEAALQHLEESLWHICEFRILLRFTNLLLLDVVVFQGSTTTINATTSITTIIDIFTRDAACFSSWSPDSVNLLLILLLLLLLRAIHSHCESVSQRGLLNPSRSSAGRSVVVHSWHGSHSRQI